LRAVRKWLTVPHTSFVYGMVEDTDARKQGALDRPIRRSTVRGMVEGQGANGRVARRGLYPIRATVVDMEEEADVSIPTVLKARDKGLIFV
jgi:hypothetical protein